MAWSEAARRAAAEARRLRAKAKTDSRLIKPGIRLTYKKKLPMVAQPEVRSYLAKQLAAARRGKGNVYESMVAARNSTLYRNAAKKR